MESHFFMNRQRILFYVGSTILLLNLNINTNYIQHDVLNSQDLVGLLGDIGWNAYASSNNTASNNTGVAETLESTNSSDTNDERDSFPDENENGNDTTTTPTSNSTVAEQGYNYTTSNNSEDDSAENASTNSTSDQDPNNPNGEEPDTNNSTFNNTEHTNQTSVAPTNAISSYIAEGSSTNSTISGNSTQLTNASRTTIQSNLTMTDFIQANQSIINLPPADFDIDISPLDAKIESGGTFTYSITITSINNFNSNVSLTLKPPSVKGINTTLSANMTIPPPNGSIASTLDIATDSMIANGKYKLKITAYSANVSKSKSVSTTLEIIGKNVTIDAIEQYDPVALTPVLIKDLQSNLLDSVEANRMVLLSTNVVNNYDKTQPFIAIIQVRDKVDGATTYLQLQKGILNPLGQLEIGISWVPDKSGLYQVYTFVVDKIEESPQPISLPVGRVVEVK